MENPNTVEHTFRVRYAETDQMGVVHNAVYLIWFETGRTEYCIAKGYPYSEIEKSGVVLVVAESKVRYRKPAHYDEMVTVRTSMTRSGSRVTRFNYQVVRKETGELIADGETVHVAVDKKSRRPTHIPQEIIDKLIS